MGLFNNYLKEGPGIDVNAPKKKGIFLFFEIFGRKFIDLIKTNSLYFLVSLPFFVFTMIFLAPLFTITFLPESLQDNMQIVALTSLMFTVIIFNYFGSGPASVAYAYVARCFTQSKHVWIMSDGIDVFKQNFKQSILFLAIDVVLIFLAVNAIGFYKAGDGAIYSFLYYLMIVLLVLYAISHTFAYQIIATYNCKIRDVYKYAIEMTIAKLPVSILIFVVTIALNILMFYYISAFNVIIYIVIYAIIGMSIAKFPLEFYAARVIEKNIEKTNTQGDNE